MNLRIARASWVTIGFLSLLVLAWTVPAWAGDRIEKTFPLNSGGRFMLDSEGGSVSVVGSDQSGASVVITSDHDDLQSLFDFDFEQEPGAVRVRARRRLFFSGWFENLGLHYEIRVPRATALDVKTSGGSIDVASIGSEATVATSGGSITVSRLTGGLSAHTSGGNIRVQAIQGDSELRTSGGEIEADSVDGSLIARTSGGSIHIRQLTGRVDARTSGGGITAYLGAKNTHGGVLETSGGSISVAIDPAANLEIDAATSGGNVHTELPVRVMGALSPHTLRGTLGSGGPTLALHTSGGSIHLSSL